MINTYKYKPTKYHGPLEELVHLLASMDGSAWSGNVEAPCGAFVGIHLDRSDLALSLADLAQTDSAQCLELILDFGIMTSDLCRYWIIREGSQGFVDCWSFPDDEHGVAEFTADMQQLRQDFQDWDDDETPTPAEVMGLIGEAFDRAEQQAKVAKP